MDTVVSLDFPPTVGGAHLWLYEVYRRWPAPVVVVTARSQPGHGALSHGGAPKHDGSLEVHRVSEPCGNISFLDLDFVSRTLADARRVSMLVRRSGERRIHALRAFPEGVVALAARLQIWRRRPQLVTYAHGEEILVARSSRQLEFLARQVYSRSDLVIANSENTKRLVHALAPRAHVAVIHPGVDSSLFRPLGEEARRTFRARFGWRDDQYVLFSVSRMEPRKNQETVIRAVAEARSAGLDVVFCCAGDGERRAYLEKLVEKLGLQHCVVFPGRITDQEKAIFMAGSDAHVLVSVQVGQMIEGFGIVFIEAAAAGIPSVAGSSGGQAEAVVDGRTGIVVDGSKLSEVNRAITLLASDPVLSRTLGANAVAWGSEHDWDRVTSRVAAAVQALGPA